MRGGSRYRSVQCADVSVEPPEIPSNSGSEDSFNMCDTFMGSLDDEPVVTLEKVDSEKVKVMQSEVPEVERLKLLAVNRFEKEKGIIKE